MPAPDAPREGSEALAPLLAANDALFERVFQARLHPEPLHVAVARPHDLQRSLDEARFPPAIRIPRGELEPVPAPPGDCLAWVCRLYSPKIGDAPPCWIFRAKGSRLPRGVIEIVSPADLGAAYALEDGDPVRVSFQY